MSETLGRFRILEPLGTDFIGSRYLAFDPQISRQVVLRTIDPSREDAEGLVREHFLQEARTAARLFHPNIIKVFGIHTDEPQPFVVLEYLEGPTLERLLADDGPLPPRRVASLLAPVADALGYAHAEGVIHRDVRPGAIVVLPGDQAVLTGFVMAKMADVVSAVTRQGLAVGTPGYACPELVTGGEADFRGDIFSLGAVIHEALTGRPPLRGRNMAETLYRIAHGEVDPPSALVDGLDGRHDRLVLRALAKSPDDRQQTMGQLRDELEAWHEETDAEDEPAADTGELPPAAETVDAPVVVPQPPPCPERAVRDDRRSRLVAVLLAAAVLVISLFGAWRLGWLGRSGEPATAGGPAAELAEEPVTEIGDAVGRSVKTDVLPVEPPPDDQGLSAEGGEESVGEVEDQPGGAGRDEPPEAEAGSSPEGKPSAIPPPTGVLEVESAPWARVTLDGRARGETPLRIAGLAEGEHRLSLASPAGGEWSGVVRISAGRPTYVFHNFRKGR